MPAWQARKTLRNLWTSLCGLARALWNSTLHRYRLLPCCSLRSRRFQPWRAWGCCCQALGLQLDDLDIDIDDESMKSLFARQTAKAGPKKAQKAVPKKESILDGKRLHLTSITLKSAKLSQEEVLTAVTTLDRGKLTPGTLEVSRSNAGWKDAHGMNCGCCCFSVSRRSCPPMKKARSSRNFVAGLMTLLRYPLTS
jgi:hypothetical protein